MIIRQQTRPRATHQSPVPPYRAYRDAGETFKHNICFDARGDSPSCTGPSALAQGHAGHRPALYRSLSLRLPVKQTRTPLYSE
ncbi:hypothetical protein SRHO_G00090160 [Serrasalmus rhombeus]